MSSCIFKYDFEIQEKMGNLHLEIMCSIYYTFEMTYFNNVIILFVEDIATSRRRSVVVDAIAVVAFNLRDQCDPCCSLLWCEWHHGTRWADCRHICSLDACWGQRTFMFLSGDSVIASSSESSFVLFCRYLVC